MLTQSGLVNYSVDEMGPTIKMKKNQSQATKSFTASSMYEPATQASTANYRMYNPAHQSSLLTASVDQAMETQNAYLGPEHDFRSSAKVLNVKTPSRMRASQTEMTKSSVQSSKKSGTVRKKKSKQKFHSIELRRSSKVMPKQAQILAKPAHMMPSATQTMRVADQSLPETYLQKYQFSDNVINNNSILTTDQISLI